MHPCGLAVQYCVVHTQTETAMFFLYQPNGGSKGATTFPAAEVCDIFIPDFWEEGIKRLSQIASWSQINAWSVKWLKQINAPAIIWYVTVW